ncbi:unnamed protein product [Ceutorhynchus assimilis]|uniref:Uncharacterized protein n=1 Tax=Ceutorhynchus assimilis TaxID=467358 RepID=A0A9N9MNA4_9CUCU|nr:unnamed protein product [Ceutorhynchus assimilis]
MSPASLDALEVERYIGACLFSQNRSKHFTKNNVYPKSPMYNGYVNFQNCPSPVEGWAGGAPLISFAGHQRGNRRQKYDENNHLAQLAVHTQGAPLILSKCYNHRKTKPQRNNVIQQTKVFENTNHRRFSSNKNQDPVNECSNGALDCFSVTSDESSGSQNSETCLPRIIKPRKRRKKDRKPTHLPRLYNQDPMNNASTNEDNKPSIDETKLNDLIGDSSSEDPKLHHSFEEVEEVKDVNGNQPVSTCQCRYCDPEGQIWDVDRSCYSPFLTPPTKTLFDFSNLLSQSSELPFKFSELSLKEEKVPFSRSASSSSTSSGDLEVSTEIVTSLNGHRDLEIKFWLNGALDAKNQLRSDNKT